MPKNTPPRKDNNRVPRAPRTLAPAEPREGERVAKVVARAGLGSRREVEEWILAGRVAVNDEVLESPARTVTPDDIITVDGNPLPDRERTRLFLYHKPKGVVTTNHDPEGRPTLFEILPTSLPRLVSVGRLDLNTEGLILLTNDGGLSRVLELPETGWLRRYRVRAKGEVTQDRLDTLFEGITVEGVHYGPIEARLDRVQGANVWVTLALREGKNREVRNVLGALGLEVNRLIRLSYGPFQLGELEQGEVEEVRTRVLADQLGETLAAAAGADFDGPMFNHADEDDTTSGKSRPRYAKSESGDDRHRRLPISTEKSPERDVKAGILADRKGRKFLVQRVRSRETEEEAVSERPARPMRESERREAEREAARFARPETSRSDKSRPDSRGGERTFRKRPDGAFSPRPREETEEAGERQERRPRPERAPSRDRRSSGPRPSNPRFEREGDARPVHEREPRPEGERPFRERAPRRDGEGQDERGFRPRGDRPERPFRERTPRPEGDRPFRERADRPERGERPEGGRSFRGAGSNRPYSGRVKSEQSRFRSRDEGRDTPRGSRQPRDGDERGERRPRPEGDRPFRPREDHPREDRAPRGDRTGGKPSGGGYANKKSFGDRPFNKEGAERPRRFEDNGRDGGERPFRDRPADGKSFGKKSFGGKPGGRPSGGKSFGGKPSGERPSGGRPFGKGPGGKPSGSRPTGGKPGGRPSGGGRGPRG